MKHHIVYRTHNLINGKEYTGKHSTDDLNDGYYGSGLGINAAVKKYGIENFAVEILSYHKTSKLAFIEEERIVNEEYVDRDDTYNQTIGGNGGSVSGENNPNYGIVRSDEYKEKLSKILLEYWTPEKRAEQSKLRSGKKNAMYGKLGKDNPRYGQKHTEEAKEKIGNANRDRVVSLETRKKLSILSTGRVLSDETKKKISDANKGNTHSKETIEQIKATKKLRNNKVFIGKNNPRAGHFIVISPTGTTIELHGEFYSFMKKQKMSANRAKQYINKGPIPKSRRPSKETDALIGWEIKRINDRY